MSSLSRAGKMSLSFKAPPPPELSVDEIIREVQRQVIKFKCRLIDIFQDYDRTRNGVISRTNYLRAFGRSVLVISEAQKNKLADAFCTVGDMRDVNYKRMCRRIDEVSVIKGLDKDPNASTKTAPINAVTGYAGTGKLSSAEREIADRKLKEMAILCAEQSLDPNSHFKDFDRANSGCVKAPQFKRLIVTGYNRMFFSKQDLNALAKMFESVPGEVNFRAMNNMVRKPTNQQPESQHEIALARPPLSATRSQQANIDLLCKMIIERAAIDDIKEGMRNYDRLITGYVERGAFKAALADFASKFSQPDLDLIADKFYDSYNEKINYNVFCSKLQERRLENTRPPRVSYDSDAIWARLLHKIRVTQQQRRFDMLPLMEDFDRRNEQLVTQSQFLRVLQHFAIDQLITEGEMNILIQKYGGQGSDRKGVSYKKFLRDLGNTVEQRSTVEVPTQKTHIAAAPMKPVYTIGTVMRKIKDKVSKQRVRLKEMFTDFDTLRNGLITRNQFTGGLLPLVDLTHEEQELVCNAFASTELDGAQLEPLVKYSEFCDNVNNVFGLSNMEKNPGADSDVAAVTALNDDIVDPQNQLTPDEEQVLRQTLKKLEAYVKFQMVHLKPPFMDFDKQRRGYITKRQFMRALRERCPQLNSTETALICKAFATPKVDSGDNVNYMWFIKAVDSADNVLGNLGQISRGAAMPKTNTNASRSEPPAARSRNLVKPDIKTLLLKLRKQSVVLAIDKPETFFQEFDRLNSGNIHRGKLPSALEKAGFRLTEGEIAVIFEKYNIDGTRVNYALLLQHLRDCSSEDSTGGKRKSEPVIQKLRHHVKQRRLEVIGVFKALDKLNEGQVTAKQFRQALSILRLSPNVLNRKEVAVLIDDYKTTDNEVVTRVRYISRQNYRGFVNDIESES